MVFHSRGPSSVGHSPISSREVTPEYTAPPINRTMLGMSRRRSSSMNSNVSNNSNLVRALSIASLDSPRNSIFSPDEEVDVETQDLRHIRAIQGSSDSRNWNWIDCIESYRNGSKQSAKEDSVAVVSDDEQDQIRRPILYPKRRSKQGILNKTEKSLTADQPQYTRTDYTRGEHVTLENTKPEFTNTENTKTEQKKNSLSPLHVELDSLMQNKPVLVSGGDVSEDEIFFEGRMKGAKMSRTMGTSKSGSSLTQFYHNKRHFFSKDLRLELLNVNNLQDRNLETKYTKMTDILEKRRNRGDTSILEGKTNVWEQSNINNSKQQEQDDMIMKWNRKWNKSLLKEQFSTDLHDASNNDILYFQARPVSGAGRSASRKRFRDDEEYEAFDN